MAVVIVIAGLILSALLPALLDIQRGGRVAATQANLQSLLRATSSYVLANGCVPCPTPSNKINSTEQGKTGVAGNAACGLCPVADGIAPFAALGVNAAIAHDGWGRWITMHVDTSLTQPCTAAELANQSPGCGANDIKLCHAALNESTKISLAFWLNPLTGQSAAANAAVLFLSHGANGYGAYRPLPSPAGPLCRRSRLDFPAGAVCDNAQNLEMCNDKCAAPDNRFYQIGTNGFDDLTIHADRNALVSLLGSASCANKW